ncbi:hypothetical protein [Mesorhizobium sp. M0208]|uniref:hypothetical protein n=1 Tax=Mesorhizobium sp. M0208 TaxID=2956916 RepID=UPI003336C421
MPKLNDRRGALSLSVGATLLDLKVSAADLGLRVGEPVEIIVDLIAAQSLQIIGSIAVSSGVAHNESNTVNPAVAGGLGYMSVGLTVTPTQNDVTFGTSLLVRLNIAAGVGANGLFVLGWAVQKAKSRLTYIGGALQSAAMVAEDAHPKLNIDPFFRIVASGVTNDYAGNPLIGASAGGFPPVLVNAPAGSPFGTKAIKLPAGHAARHQDARSRSRVDGGRNCLVYLRLHGGECPVHPVHPLHSGVVRGDPDRSDNQNGQWPDVYFAAHRGHPERRYLRP